MLRLVKRPVRQLPSFSLLPTSDMMNPLASPPYSVDSASFTSINSQLPVDPQMRALLASTWQVLDQVLPAFLRLNGAQHTDSATPRSRPLQACARSLRPTSSAVMATARCCSPCSTQRARRTRSVCRCAINTVVRSRLTRMHNLSVSPQSRLCTAQCSRFAKRASPP